MSPARVNNEDTERTADLLHSGAIHLLRRLRTSDATAGLTGAQSSAISVLIYGGPQTISALAAAEHVQLPTMSRLVKDLLAAGLVTRATHATDARSTIITPTAHAKTMFAKARALRLDRLQASIATLTESEQRILQAAAALLQRVAAGVEAIEAQ